MKIFSLRSQRLFGQNKVRHAELFGSYFKHLFARVGKSFYLEKRRANLQESRIRNQNLCPEFSLSSFYVLSPQCEVWTTD